MTGNNKVWRMPVAGLASVAMIATMGVAAMTANADDVTYNVTFHANGGVLDTAVVSANGGVVSANGDSITIKTTRKDTLNPKSIDKAIEDALVSDDGDGSFLTDEGATLATKAENAFTGWYSSPNPGAAVDPDSPVSGNIDLYAHWSTDPVTVNFDGAGINENATVKVAPSDSLAAWQVPGDLKAGDGKLLDHWVSALDNSTVVDPLDADWDQLAAAGQSVNNDVALTAVGASRVFNVTFEKNHKDLWFYEAGKATPWLNTYSYDVAGGTSINAPVARYVEDASKMVTAWRAENDKNNATFPKVINQNYVFKAVDNAHGYTVNFWYDYENKAESTLTLLSSTTVGEDEAVAKPADPTRDGYVFVGWVDYNGKAWDFDNNVSNDNTSNGVLNLYAKWTKAAASVKFHTNSDDAESIITKSFTTGDKFTAPEVTRDGYVLDGWYEGKTGNEVTYFGRTLRLVPGATADDVTLQYAATSATGSNTGVEVVYQTLDTDFYAHWKRADESAIKDQEAVTPASLLYTDGDSTKPFLPESKYFTTESFNEFTDWYDSTYLPAQNAAQVDGYTNAEAAKLVSMLKEAQSKLVFKTDATVWRFEKDGKHIYAQGKKETDNLLSAGWKHETYGDLQTVGIAGLPQATVDELLTKVARLREKATGQYMLTADQNEINVLTADGAWKNETFSMVYAPKNGTTPVYRLYLKYNNEHLITADANEYNVQAAKTDLFHGDGVNFYLY